MQDVDCSVKNGANGNQWSVLDLQEQPNGSQRDNSTKSDHIGGEGGGVADGPSEDGVKVDGKTERLPTTNDSYLASTIKSFNKLSIGQSPPMEPKAAALNSFLALTGGVAWPQGTAPPGDADFPLSSFPGFPVSGGAASGTRHADPSQGRYHPQWQSAGPQVAGYMPQVQYTNSRRTYTHGWGNEGMPPRLGWGAVHARNGVNPPMRATNGQVGRCLPGNEVGYALQGQGVTNYPGFNSKSSQNRVFARREDDRSTEDLKTMLGLNQDECRFHGYEMPKANIGLDAQLLDLLRSQQEVLKGSNSWTSSCLPESRMVNKGKPFTFNDMRTGPGPLSAEGTQVLSKATVVNHLMASAERVAASLGLHGAHDRGECYSRKVFVGGLPPDIDEDEILAAFRRFGPLAVDWPHKAESKSYFPPKGYCFLLFQDELSVQSLVEACIVEDGKLFWYVSSPTTKDKPVQIRPWSLADSDLVMDNSQPIDPRKTVFVGGVPRPLKAVELAMIMSRLYGGVCYAGIDTDPELKYPKGAGRVAFSNQQSYIAAISARFVQLQHGDVDKRVEVKPYVLDDQICDECQGLHSGGKFAPFFCANVLCLQYYCERCWAVIHSSPGREFHKPLVKEGTDRPRPMPFHWS